MNKIRPYQQMSRTSTATTRTDGLAQKPMSSTNRPTSRHGGKRRTVEDQHNKNHADYGVDSDDDNDDARAHLSVSSTTSSFHSNNSSYSLLVPSSSHSSLFAPIPPHPHPSNHSTPLMHRPSSQAQSQRPASTFSRPITPSTSSNTSSSVPLHALRARGVGSNILGRQNSDESIHGYSFRQPSPRPNSSSPFTHTDSGDDDSHSSSTSSLTGSHNSATYLPPATASSPRRSPNSHYHHHGPPPKSAASVSPSLASSFGNVVSPLAQRFSRTISNPSAHAPPPPPNSSSNRPSTSSTTGSMRSQNTHHIQTKTPSSISQSSNFAHTVTNAIPVRASHHLGSSSSLTEFHPSRAATGFVSESSPSSSSLSSSSSTLLNVWSRDASANRVGVGASTNRPHPSNVALVIPRPTTSHSSVRPVTARANLFSARCDQPDHESDSFDIQSAASVAAIAAAKRLNSHELRLQTAGVDSSGAQARARSAHLPSCRPPSRQRPPNQALHLGDGGEPTPVNNNGRTTSARGRHGWQQDGVNTHHARSNSSSSGLHPVVDLFPAAPVELVRAVKSASRLRTAVGRSHSPPSPLVSSDWDTDSDTDHDSDTNSFTTDCSDAVNDDGVNVDSSTSLRSSSTSPHTGDVATLLPSEPGFVSLHNLLQLQSELPVRKSRSGTGATSSRKSSRGSQRREIELDLEGEAEVDESHASNEHVHHPTDDDSGYGVNTSSTSSFSLTQPPLSTRPISRSLKQRPTTGR